MNKLNKYVFITSEGLTCTPNCDSSIPDFQDMQIIGFGNQNSIQDAIQDLLELNDNLVENRLEKVFSLELKSGSKSYFWEKERKDKLTLAS